MDDSKIQELKRHLETEQGKVLHDFILAHYNVLKNIENMREYDTTASQALEIKATKKALQILANILTEIDSLKEMNILDQKPEDSLII
jgi:hypothetical protein